MFTRYHLAEDFRKLGLVNQVSRNLKNQEQYTSFNPILQDYIPFPRICTPSMWLLTFVARASALSRHVFSISRWFCMQLTSSMTMWETRALGGKRLIHNEVQSESDLPLLRFSSNLLIMWLWASFSLIFHINYVLKSSVTGRLIKIWTEDISHIPLYPSAATCISKLLTFLFLHFPSLTPKKASFSICFSKIHTIHFHSITTFPILISLLSLLYCKL